MSLVERLSKNIGVTLTAEAEIRREMSVIFMICGWSRECWGYPKKFTPENKTR